MIPFSILDLSPVTEGSDPAQSFRNSLSLARHGEKLGYRRDGTEAVARRGQLAEDVRLLVGRGTFRRPGWTLEVEGVEACLPMLGVTRG